MNTRSSQQRRSRRLADQEPDTVTAALPEEVYAETGMIPPECYPDPWLYDTPALLRELDQVRETILQIPLSAATFGPTNAAVTRVWELRHRLQYLFALTKEGQRDWQTAAQQTEQSEPRPKSSQAA